MTKNFTRKDFREHAVAVIYMHIVSGRDIDELLEDNEFSSSISDFIPFLPLDEEMQDACYRVQERFDIYERVVDSKLKQGWRFARLGKLEQSILLLALAELEQGFQDKPIIVNEAVELAKKYADENAYKFINGVLDSL